MPDSHTCADSEIPRMVEQDKISPSAHRQDYAVLSAAIEHESGEPRIAAFEQEETLTAHDAAPSNFGLVSHSLQEKRHSPRFSQFCFKAFVVLVISLSCLSILLTGLTLGRAPGWNGRDAPESILAKRLAFGSCTQRHVGENPIWEKAIVPAMPDVWVWLGDLAYMDIPAVDCYSKENKDHPDCNCTPTLMRHPSHGCRSGDEQNARRKADAIVRSSGSYPPLGADPAVCPRHIFGVYDDHDFSWNNGNGYQLAKKAALKQVFLDAIGEDPSSSRRLGGQGIYEHRVLNKGHKGKEIDLVLLDERYERVPLPCHTRRYFCQPSIEKSPSREVWCEDFLGLGNITRPPSCCRKDDEIQLSWCQQDGASNDERYSSACDPWSAEFGTQNWAVSSDGDLRMSDPTQWQDVQDESSFCEMLGKKQRSWLNVTLDEASGAVMLIGSGSVVLGHPEKLNDKEDSPPYTLYCSGDDWDCYRPAQKNLISMLSRRLSMEAAGCVVILTGDYHHADIKRIVPGEEAVYNEYLEPPGMSRPIWQIMASGMDPSTATGLDTSCGDVCCSWWRDDAGLRGPDRSCHVYGDPNFGVVDLDFDAQVISLSIIAGDTGSVAMAADGALLQVQISMKTCEAIG